MRFRITIQAKTDAKGSSGQPVGTWATFKTVWAGIDPLKGTELFTAQATEAAHEVVFNIRYLAGVTVKHRISWDSRTFDIKSVVKTRN
jgi:SPP1 family predicted phage head-tail adaptor